MNDFKSGLIQPDRTEAMLRQAAQHEQMRQQAMQMKIMQHVNTAALVFAQAVGPRLKDWLERDDQVGPNTGALRQLAKQALRCAIEFHAGLEGENIP